MQTTLTEITGQDKAPDPIRTTEIYPVIISASRSTDIPAWYMDWFIDRLQKGFIIWTNPYRPTHQQIVRFDATRAIVFWTKNPAPLIPYISFLEDNGYHFYVHVTLNDYEREHLEPNLPSCCDRIASLIELSHCIGKNRIIWRFDPIIVTDSLPPSEIISRIERIGDNIVPFVNRMIFSFIQIARYRNVRVSLHKHKDHDIRESTEIERDYIVRSLHTLSHTWGIPVDACGEYADYSMYGIHKARCIDPDLLIQISDNDTELHGYLSRNRKKDPGQRASCSCIRAKDIGQYSTCMHMCRYCYANRNEQLVYYRYHAHKEAYEKGMYLPQIVPEIH